MEYDNGEILRGILKIDGRAVRMRQCEAVSESAVRVNQQDGQNLLSENLLFTVCKSVNLCLPTRGHAESPKSVRLLRFQATSSREVDEVNKINKIKKSMPTWLLAYQCSQRFL